MVGVVATNYDIIPKSTVPGGADRDRDIVVQAGTPQLLHRGPSNPAVAGVDAVSRAVNLQYQQFGAYAEGAHRFNAQPAGHRRRARRHQHPLHGDPDQPAGRAHRTAASTGGWRSSTSSRWPTSRRRPTFAYNIFDNGVQISTGNPDLKPERARSNEVNVSWRTEYLLAQRQRLLQRAVRPADHQPVRARPRRVVSPEVYVNPDGTGPRRLAQSVNLGTSNGDGARPVLPLQHRPRLRLGLLFATSTSSATLGPSDSGLPESPGTTCASGAPWPSSGKLSLTPSLVLRSTPENLPDSYRNAGVSLQMPYEINVNALFTPVEPLDLW